MKLEYLLPLLWIFFGHINGFTWDLDQPFTLTDEAIEKNVSLTEKDSIHTVYIPESLQAETPILKLNYNDPDDHGVKPGECDKFLNTTQDKSLVFTKMFDYENRNSIFKTNCRLIGGSCIDNPSPCIDLKVFYVNVNDEIPSFEEPQPGSRNIRITENTTNKTLLLISAEDLDIIDQSISSKLDFSISNSENVPFNLTIIDDTSVWLGVPDGTLIDYEQVQFWPLVIEVKDQFDQFDNQNTNSLQLNVGIDDVGDTPPIIQKYQQNWNVNESITQIGADLFTIEAYDPDRVVDNSISYEITNITYNDIPLEENKKFIEIEKLTGKVKTTKIIDREEWNSTSYFMVEFVAEELNCTGGPELCRSEPVETRLQIQDIDDNPPVITADITNITIDENGYSNDFQSIFINDKDFDYAYNTYSIRIESDEPLAKQQIELSATDGFQETQIFFRITSGGSPNDTLLDYEKRQTVEFSLVVTSTNEEVNYQDIKNFQINLNDVNDNDPTFTQSEYNLTFKEDLSDLPKFGETMVILTDLTYATDLDGTDKYGTESLIYDCNSRFELTIDNKTGTIYFDTSSSPKFDFDENPNETFDITVKDQQGSYGYRTGRAKINIKLKDVNDEQPKISLINGNKFCMYENSTDQWPITPPDCGNGYENISNVVIEAEDVDTDANLTMRIDWEHSEATNIDDQTVLPSDFNYTACFYLDSTFEKQKLQVRLQLVDGCVDREKIGEIKIQLEVKDENTVGTFPSTDTSSVTIGIADIDDTAPIFVNAEDWTFSIEETFGDTEEEKRILDQRIKVRDLDEDQIFTFEMVAHEGFEFANDLIILVPNNETNDEAYLQVVKPIDRENEDIILVNGTLRYVISVYDGQNNTNHIEIEIEILDQNDCSPTFIQNGIPNNQYQFSLPEDKTNNTLVFTLEVEDKDISEKFREIEFQPIDLFVPFYVNATTGEITVYLRDENEKLDFDSEPKVYFFTVIARDNPGFSPSNPSDPATITISLIDVNDNAPSIDENDSHVTIENTIQTEILYTYSAEDIDGPSFNTFKFYSDFAENDLFFIKENGDLCNNTALTEKNDSYTFNIWAIDNGGKISKNLTFEINIMDVNDQFPIFTYPKPNQMIFINEDASIGQLVDRDGENVTLKALDADAYEPFNEIHYRFSGSEDSVITDHFEIDSTTGQITVLKTLNDLNEEIQMNVVAYDNQNDLDNSRKTELTVNLTISKEYPPEFNITSETVTKFKEGNFNSDETWTFTPATDKNIDKGEEDTIYYYLYNGTNDIPNETFDGAEYFQVDKISSTLKQVKIIDRETTPNLMILIGASNIGAKKPDIEEIPQTGILKIIIQVQDINDEFPKFAEPKIFRSISLDDYENWVTTVAATDADLNDTFTYSKDKFIANGTDLNNVPENAFNVSTDQNRARITTSNFPLTASMKGYFTFNLYVSDKANHNVSVPFRVVIINAEVNKINLNFDNSINEIIDNQSELKQIFDENFDGWEFNIDKVEDPGNSKENTNKNSGSARVACYFLEIETYDPVSNSIAKVKYDTVFKNLTLALSELELTLNQQNGFSIGDEIDPVDGNTNSLAIVFGIVVTILVVMFAFLAIAYVIRVRHLERKIKAIDATSTAVGKPQENGHLEHFKEPLPNTNQHTSQGANPMWNPDEEEDITKMKNKVNPLYQINNQENDYDSDGSGDSVIIGVEDQDDFKDYQERYDDTTSEDSGPTSNNDFAGFALPLDRYSKKNPLFDESEL